MATDFIMPRLPGQQPQQAFYPHQQQQHQQYRPQQSVPFQPPPISTGLPPSSQFNSPVSPLSTPGNASSTSTKNYISRQIRPLYVPAVLRPTEFPSKAPPPRSNLQDEDETSEESLRHNNSFISLGGLGGLSAFGRLNNRRSTADRAKSVDGSWNLDLFPKPTGAPTRKHWKVCHAFRIAIAALLQPDASHANTSRYYSPTSNPRCAITRHARDTSATSPAGTIAVNVATSSATCTAHSRYPSIKTRTTIPGACPAVRALTATRSSKNGAAGQTVGLRAMALPIPTALTPLLPRLRPLLPSPASAGPCTCLTWPTASRETGTGALSKMCHRHEAGWQSTLPISVALDFVLCCGTGFPTSTLMRHVP
jgi:hypothetical protein